MPGLGASNGVILNPAHWDIVGVVQVERNASKGSSSSDGKRKAMHGRFDPPFHAIVRYVVAHNEEIVQGEAPVVDWNAQPKLKKETLGCASGLSSERRKTWDLMRDFSKLDSSRRLKQEAPSLQRTYPTAPQVFGVPSGSAQFDAKFQVDSARREIFNRQRETPNLCMHMYTCRWTTDQSIQQYGRTVTYQEYHKYSWLSRADDTHL